MPPVQATDHDLTLLESDAPDGYLDKHTHARITIAPNGSARARMPWEAVKMKWAPEKYRGTPPERGYPRAPAGPLAKGTYTVKMITPLVGVSEGVDHEMTAPKVEIEIEK